MNCSNFRCVCTFYFMFSVWQCISRLKWNISLVISILMFISFITAAAAAKFCNSHDQHFWWNANCWPDSIESSLWFLVSTHSDKPSNTSSSFNKQTALRIAPFWKGKIEKSSLSRRDENQKLKNSLCCKCTLMVENVVFCTWSAKKENFHIRGQKEFH